MNSPIIERNTYDGKDKCSDGGREPDGKEGELFDGVGVGRLKLSRVVPSLLFDVEDDVEAEG